MRKSIIKIYHVWKKKQKESRLIEDIYRINLRSNKGIKDIQEVTSRQNNVRSVYMLCVKYHICVNAKTQLSLKGIKEWHCGPNMNEYIPEPEILPMPNLMFLCYISFLQCYTNKKKKIIHHDILHQMEGHRKVGKSQLWISDPIRWQQKIFDCQKMGIFVQSKDYT